MFFMGNDEIESNHNELHTNDFLKFKKKYKSERSFSSIDCESCKQPEIEILWMDFILHKQFKTAHNETPASPP